MRRSTRRWLASLALPALLSLAGCPPPEHGDEGDDDTNPPGDDDSADPGDDDDATPPGDDDDTTGDDDDMILYGARSDDDTAPRHPALLRQLRA